jgi:hypothetical protein
MCCDVDTFAVDRIQVALNDGLMSLDETGALKELQLP